MSLLREGGSEDEDVFNMSVRRFLKKLGVTAQRDIEHAVREQFDAGALRGDERWDAEGDRHRVRSAAGRRRDGHDRTVLSARV